MKNSNVDNTVTPFLRWAGSKKKILPILSEYWDSSCFLRYIEPFAGSAALFFHLNPKKALLGDVNKELMLTYRQLKNNVDAVINTLNSYNKNKKTYLSLRSKDPNKLTRSERASRFIYLNRYCFNGLYRINKKGQFNVPYGGKVCGRMPSGSALRSCSRRLKNVSLVAGSFNATLENVTQGDFVYMDPPYKVNKRKIFTEYDTNVFDQDAVIKLRWWLEYLNKNNIAFLVSYADSDEAKYLSQGFRVRKIKIRRNIAGFISNRRLDTEVLISNKAPIIKT